MDISAYGLAINWLPRLPSITGTAIRAVLGYSENTKYQDALTECIVASARPVLGTPAPLLQSQIAFKRDVGIFGQMWIAKYTIPPPESSYESTAVLGIRQAVAVAIKELDQYPTETPYEISDLVAVETEWTGYRPKASHISLRPNASEEDMYQRMASEVADDCPILIYFHGGAHCLMDPSTHRWTTSSLAKESKGLVLSVRYRLSPQSIFPAALLDGFTAYLALISPPPAAFHKPIHPSRIILAGESSGAGLATSLLLLLLTLSRHQVSIRFHGHDIKIPAVPCAGLAIASAWLDVSRALPSTTQNCRWDIVAPPPVDSCSPPFPPDAIWPTEPPRAETFCTAPLVTHPLVSPVAARPEHWSGAPPVFICTGWEVFEDENEVFARRVYQSGSGAVVVFQGYEGMPHCFMMVPWNRRGCTALKEWGQFCYKATRPRGLERTDSGTWTDKYGKVREVKLELLGLTKEGCGYDRTRLLDDATVDKMMEVSRNWRVAVEDKMVEDWKNKNGPRTAAIS